MLNDFLNVGDIPEILYHATYKRRLRNIKLNGLIPGKKKNWEGSKKDVVYLATDYEEAGSFVECDETDSEDDIYVISIDASKLNLDNLSRDENVIDGDSTYEYKGIIPPDAFIEIKLFE